MPQNYDKLERYILKAIQQALAEDRQDVADKLLYALEALDAEFESFTVTATSCSIPDIDGNAPKRQRS